MLSTGNNKGNGALGSELIVVLKAHVSIRYLLVRNDVLRLTNFCTFDPISLPRHWLKIFLWANERRFEGKMNCFTRSVVVFDNTHFYTLEARPQHLKQNKKKANLRSFYSLSYYA